MEESVCFLVYLSWACTGGIVLFRDHNLTSVRALGRAVKAEITNTERIQKIINTINPPESRAENVSIDISHKNYQALMYQLNLANKIGSTYKNHPLNPGFVPAVITHMGEKYKAKVKIKGRFGDHWGEKFSLSVKITGGKTVMGMKHFSLQAPEARSMVLDMTVSRWLRKENLIALRYKLLNINLNGQQKGLYLLEESMGKQLIENNNRREGMIMGMSGDILWQSSFHKTVYVLYDESHVLADSALSPQAERAVGLFLNSQSKHLLFDQELIAKAYAIATLFGHSHATHPPNARFYYNPVTLKFEPVIREWNTVHHPSTFSQILYKVQWLHKPIQSGEGEFYEKYIFYLKKFSAPGYLENFFDEQQGFIDEQTDILHQEYFNYDFSPAKEALFINRNKIREWLQPGGSRATVVHFKETGPGRLVAEGKNITDFPLIIKGLRLSDELFFPAADSIILPVKGDFTPAIFTFPKNFVWHDSLKTELKAEYAVWKSGLPVNSVEVKPWRYTDENFKSTDFTFREHRTDFDFLEKDEAAKIFRIKTGKHTLSETLIIPKNYTLICEPGTELDLQKGGKIISYSACKFIGTENRPITVFSSDSLGSGISVLQTGKEKSIFKHVVFKGLSQVSDTNWSLPGAVCFYESEVKIDNCLFYGNLRGDDYLNIVRSKFELTNSSFHQVNADAFDGDFVNGSITNCFFSEIGNDALDFSGSNITVEKVRAENVGDKVFSAGERTKMQIGSSEAHFGEIAVAAKDWSEINIRNSKIINCKLAYTAFQKKPEFGPANITARYMKVEKTERLHLIEKKSGLLLDGKPAPVTDKKVEDILYGAEYGKSSK